MEIGTVPLVQPIFVTGVYRSGTTFVASLIGAHNDVSATAHTVKFLRFCLRRYGDLANLENVQNLIEDTSSRLKTRWRINLDEEAILGDAVRQNLSSYAEIYDFLMRRVALSQKYSALRWLEKVNCNWSAIPDFLEMFPEGKVIHVIRDPRDVTASYKFMTLEQGNHFLDAAFNCRGSMESFDGLEAKHRSRVLPVKIEFFSQNPEDQVWQIESFLGLSHDDRMLDPSKFEALGGSRWETNTSFNEPHVGWPKNSPRWPIHLTAPELLLVEIITQPFLSKFGYLASGGSVSESEWSAARSLLDTPFLERRLRSWVSTGKGAEGYVTDPYEFEMRMVFPDRFTSS